MQIDKDSVDDVEACARVVDAIALPTALQRLLRAAVCSEAQLYDYGLAQALRGLFVAVRSAAHVPVPRLYGGGSAHMSSAAATMPPWASAATCETPLRAPGSCVALYMLSLECAAATRPRRCTCAIYLATRLLCDAASHYGKGNERPCCTQPWTDALLGFAADADTAMSTSSTPSSSAAAAAADAAAFARLCRSDRRYTLGYLVLTAGVLRMVAARLYPPQQQHTAAGLWGAHTALAQAWVTRLLPRVARLAEGLDDAHDAAAAAATAPLLANVSPSRLTVEANHFVIHCFHWLCHDVLVTYSDDDDGVSEDNTNDGDAARRQRPRRRVLDRHAPQQLWHGLTCTRNALRRGLSWIAAQLEQQVMHAANDSHGNSSSNSNSGRVKEELHGLSLLRATSQHLDEVVTGLLKQQEQLTLTRAAVARRYGGERSRDYHEVTELLWLHTVRMCALVRDVTATWMYIHGGLATEYNTGVVLRRERDVVAYLASTILHIPCTSRSSGGDGGGGGTGESEADVFTATCALLTACMTVALAAPLRSLQSALWLADVRYTQQVHSLLVQRALHYRDERVLRLTALLAGSIVAATTTSGAATRLACDSTEQLLDLLSSSSLTDSSSSGDGGDARDAAAHCVIELLTHAVVARPHTVVPSLFRLLRHGSTAARRNALDVLAALPTLSRPRYSSSADDERDGGAAVSRAALRDVLRVLAEHVLLHLHDAELCVRVQSASLFAKVWPEDVLVPLLRLAAQRDGTGRVQSFAQAALTSLVEAHVDDADVLLLLLQASAHVALPIHEQQSQSLGRCDGGGVPAIPTTPGDVLPRALLYTATVASATGTDDNDDDDDTNVSAPTQQQQQHTSSSSSSSSSKQARVTALVRTLCERWAAAVPQWTAAAHIAPLLRFLQEQQQHKDECAEVTRGGAAPSQWYVTHILHVLSFVTERAAVTTTTTTAMTDTASAVTAAVSTTQPSTRAPLLSATAAASVYAAVLHAIVDVFVMHSSRCNDDEDKNSSGGGSVAAAAAASSSSSWSAALQRLLLSSSPSSPSDVYACVLPLMCLRACARQVFASASPLLQQQQQHRHCRCDGSGEDSAVAATATVAAPVMHDGGDDTHARAYVAYMLAPRRDEDDAAHGSAADVVRVQQRHVWRTLWSLLLAMGGADDDRRSSNSDGGATSAEDARTQLQRVLLEVVCKYDARLVFAALQQQQQQDDNNVCARHDRDSVLRRIFHARVYLFAFLSYMTSLRGALRLDADVCTEHSSTKANSDNDDDDDGEGVVHARQVAATLQQACGVVHIARDMVLPWLTRSDDDDDADGHNKDGDDADVDARRASSTALQKLSRACVHALALLVTASLSRGAAVWEAHTALTLQPLTAYAARFRRRCRRCARSDNNDDKNNSDDGVDGTTTDGSANDSTATHAVQVATTQLALHVHRCVLDVLAGVAQRDSVDGATRLLLRWLSCMLPPLIELANAACAARDGDGHRRTADTTSDECVTATTLACECGDLLFRAVMLSSRLQPTRHEQSARSSAGGEAADAAAVLQRLPLADQHALVSFAVGCTRHDANARVQDVGVRLLSALLGAAPELFAHTTTATTTKSAAVQSPSLYARPHDEDAALAALPLLHDAVRALRAVAQMHSSAATRTLAERVLQTMTAPAPPLHEAAP